MNKRNFWTPFFSLLSLCVIPTNSYKYKRLRNLLVGITHKVREKRKVETFIHQWIHGPLQVKDDKKRKWPMNWGGWRFTAATLNSWPTSPISLKNERLVSGPGIMWQQSFPSHLFSFTMVDHTNKRTNRRNLLVHQWWREKKIREGKGNGVRPAYGPRHRKIQEILRNLSLVHHAGSVNAVSLCRTVIPGSTA